MSTNYDRVASIINEFISMSGLPRPTVRPSLPTDPCDFTNADEIRINSAAAGEGVTDARHAAHVFGHWICCLHCERDTEGRSEADQVADFVADLLLCNPSDPN